MRVTTRCRQRSLKSILLKSIWSDPAACTTTPTISASLRPKTAVIHPGQSRRCGPDDDDGATISQNDSHSRVVQTNDRRLSTKSSGKDKRKASKIEVGRSKAKEDEAVRRILSTRTTKVHQAVEGGGAAAADETDDELIEQCWQDLLTDDARQVEHRENEAMTEETEAKRYKHQEPTFDDDPKLPGDSNITKAIMTRLWNESKGSVRISIDEHARIHGIHEGKRSQNFAVQTRGASSERGSKGRKRDNDMHAIQRLVMQRTTTACSGTSRNGAIGSGSSDDGPGSFTKKPH
jgi:hypothetical protein